MRAFFRSLFGLARAHPLAFVLFLFAVVLTLGGAVWWVLGRLLGLLRKVPGGDVVAKGVASVARATGSAALLLLPAGALVASALTGAPFAPFIG